MYCVSRHVRKTYIRTCAPSDDSDQPAHSRRLIRIVTGRIFNSQRCIVSSCRERRLGGSIHHILLWVVTRRTRQKVRFLKMRLIKLHKRNLLNRLWHIGCLCIWKHQSWYTYACADVEIYAGMSHSVLNTRIVRTWHKIVKVYFKIGLLYGKAKKFSTNVKLDDTDLYLE